MRKLVLFLSLFFLLVLVKPATAADFSPSTIIGKVEDAMVRIESKRLNAKSKEIVTGFSGSGFIVYTDSKETMVITAKHVVDDSQAVDFAVIFKDKVYMVGSNVTRLPKTDAAYLIVKPGIVGAKAFSMNLSPDDSTVDALCFGYAQHFHLRNETARPTFTCGKLSRKVAREYSYGEDYDVITGIMFGTPTLLFGYSGGACTDLDYNLLGINVAFSSQTAMFVDIRVVWNSIPELNRGRKVIVPFDPEFHVSNTLGESRMAAPIDTKLVLPTGEVLIRNYLSKLMADAAASITSDQLMAAGMFGMNLPMPDKAKEWITPDAKIKMGNKLYEVYSAEVSMTLCQTYQMIMSFRNKSTKYIYFCEKGWEVQIFISEVTTPPK